MADSRFKKVLEPGESGTLLSRRKFMRNAVLGASALSLGGALLVACAGDEDDESAGAVVGDDENPDDADDGDDHDENDLPDAAARRGGQLRIAMSAPTDNFHPHHNVGWESIWPNTQIYSNLTRMSHDMEVIPDLATSWEVADDGMSWTITIREGVTFHNGNPCVASHVAESFERMIDPDEGVPVRAQFLMIESMDTVSDTEVVFHLNQIYADMPAALTASRALVFDVSLTESLYTEPVGTGPYKLQRLQPGERVILERYEDYFNAENEGFVEEVQYISIPEETARITALIGGDVDLIPEIRPAIFPTVADIEHIVTDETTTGGYQPFVMDTRNEPFNDNRVRMALKLCANRDEMLQATVQGHGETAADHPIPSIDPMWADLGIPQQDHERARELLAEAGYPDGLEIELHTSPGRPGMQEAALAIQEMAAPAGIEIEVVNHPIDAFWADVWMQRTFTMSNWAAYAVPDMMLSVAYMSDSPWNETYWQSDAFDELVILGRETLDEDERREIYREIQEVLSREGGALIAYFSSIITACRSTVKGHRAHPLQMLEPRWVWIEE